MSKRYVFLEDLQAAEIGLSYESGLLYTKDQIVDDLLPGVEAKLLELGKIQLESEWLKGAKPKAKAKDSHTNKAKTPARNKRK